MPALQPGDRATYSLIELIARPAEFHKRRVNVSGFYVGVEESSVLYVDEVSARNRLIANGVSVAFGTCESLSEPPSPREPGEPLFPPEADSANGQYVLANGVFWQGRSDFRVGVLCSLESFVPLKDSRIINREEDAAAPAVSADAVQQP